MLGSGTANDPYQIFTRADLEAVANDYTAHYKLMNDIDLSDGEWTPLPLRDANNNYFMGVFDGNGFTISNLTIKATNVRNALFQQIFEPAVIKRLKILNAKVEPNNSHYNAILVGAMGLNTTIEECHVEGEIKINGNYGFSAGLVGNVANNCIVRNNFFKGTVTVGLRKEVGGLIGNASGINTVINGNISVAVINNPNNVADVGGSFAGYIVPNLYPKVTNNFCDVTLDPKAKNYTGVINLTTAQLQTASTYTNKLSPDIWIIKDGQYPELKAFEEPVIIEDRNVLSYVDNINSDIMLNKVATVKRVSSIKEFSADTQKIIKAVKVGTTFVKDIVSGVSREIQVVKVGKETVTSYILPITTNVETMKKQVNLLDKTVTSYIRPITSDVQREIKSLRQSLSFIDVIVGRVITPNLTPKQIKAIVSHIENGTLAHYLNSQYNVSMLTDLSVQSRIENSSSVNALENQTLSEVRE